MSKSNAIRSMFTFSNVPTTKHVVKDRESGAVRPAQSETMSEIERLRAENAALRAKQSGSPKAKPATIPTKVQLVDVNGTKCVEISGNFKPLYLSLAKWNLVKTHAETIESLFNR